MRQRLRTPSICSNASAATSNTAGESAFATPVYYPLHLAAATGNTAALRQLLNGTPPAEACKIILDSASMDMLPGLLDDLHGGVRKSQRFFYSPLFLAVYRGHTDAVGILLEACSGGDDVDADAGDDEADGIGLLADGGRTCGGVSDPLGRTPLHYAAHAGHLEMCRLLVRHPLSRADPASRDAIFQWNAVHHAASQGHVAAVHFFLRWQADERSPLPASEYLANVTDEQGRTPLMLAAQNRHPAVIELLTSTLTIAVPRSTVSVTSGIGASRLPQTPRLLPLQLVDAVDVYGRNAFHRAAANGHTECMKLLLDAGASLTSADFRGRQALHLAASGGQVHSIAFLLRALVRQATSASCAPAMATSAQASTGKSTAGVGKDGSDGVSGPESEALTRLLCPNDLRGFTPLHLAAFAGNLECLQSLIQCRVYRQLRGNIFSPLHCAALRGNVSCVEELLRSYAQPGVKLQDFRGRTALHVAAMGNQLPCLNAIIAYLMDKSGSDGWPVTALEDALCQGDGDGCTPLMLAARAGAVDTCQRLITIASSSAPDSIGRVDSDGRSLLHHALAAPNEKVALLLLTQRQHDVATSLNRPSGRTGQTPLHLAVEAGYARTTSILLSRGVNVFAVDNQGQLPVCAGSSAGDQSSKCVMALLLAMMPNLRSKLPPGVGLTFAAGDPSPRSSYHHMTDSIHSSDSEFF